MGAVLSSPDLDQEVCITLWKSYYIRRIRKETFFIFCVGNQGIEELTIGRKIWARYYTGGPRSQQGDVGAWWGGEVTGAGGEMAD